jgi:hypothetical protein
VRTVLETHTGIVIGLSILRHCSTSALPVGGLHCSAQRESQARREMQACDEDIENLSFGFRFVSMVVLLLEGTYFLKGS